MIQYLNIFGGSEKSGEQNEINKWIKVFNPHIPAFKMNYNVFTICRKFTKTFLKLEFTI